MKEKYTTLTAEAIREASEKLYKIWPQQRSRFVVLHPNHIAHLKRQASFEPLSGYIDEVKPVTGEVGRYDVDGMKIRIVQASTIGGEADAQES